MTRAILVAAVVAMAFSVAAQQADSPLVAAAKRTNRLAKKPAKVITNDDLATSSGRISGGTATAESSTPAPSNIGSAAALPDWAAMEAAAAARRAAQAQQGPSATAPQIEGSSRASYSVRPSSVTNATMGSTVATTMLPSSARTVGGQSTATSASYDQTAPASTRNAAAPTRRD